MSKVTPTPPQKRRFIARHGLRKGRGPAVNKSVQAIKIPKQARISSRGGLSITLTESETASALQFVKKAYNLDG